MANAQLSFMLEVVPEPPAPLTPWQKMAMGLRETNEPQGERVEYLHEQVQKLNQGK